MEDCHVLLGIHPMAGTDEIEEAYRNKMRAFDPKQFEEGSAEWKDAVAMQETLKQAYDDAIMATFAPIRAFSSSTPAATPVASRPPETVRQAEPSRSPTPQSYTPEPRRTPPPSGYDMQNVAPVRSTWTPPSRKDSNLEGLVEEVPVSFSDEDLLKMDITQLRETYAPPQKERSWLPTLGIQDPLLRSWVWMYLSFTLLDFLMRLAMGNSWGGVNRILEQTAGVLKEALPAGASVTLPPPPSALWSLATSVVSMLYLFVCSLIMPVVVRFFILGEPVIDKRMMRWMLDLASIAAAWLIMIPAGLLFKILPAEWAGSSLNLLFVTPLLCEVTLRYQGE